MADLKYNVTVDTASAQQSLQRLQQSTERSQRAFSALSGAIAAIGVGALIRSLGNAANAMADLAAASGFSVQAIEGLSQAFTENGGSAQKAQDAILRFNQTLGAAAQGSKGTLDSFQRLGITLAEIDRLDEQELFRRTIDGLGRIPDAATRSRLAVELLGRGVAGVDFRTLAAGQDEYIAAAARSSVGIEAAGRANQALTNTVRELQTRLLEVLAPISNLATALLQNREAINRVFVAIQGLVTVVGPILLVIGAFNLFGRAISTLFGAIGSIRAGVASLVKTFQIFRSQVRAVIRDGEVTKKTITALEERFRWLGRGVGLVTRGLTVLGGALAAVAGFVIPDRVQEALRKLYERLAGGVQVTEDLSRAQEDAAQAAAEQAAGAQRLAALQEENNKKFAESVRLLRVQARGYFESADALEKQLRTQQRLIGATEQQRNLVATLQQAETAYLAEASRLQQELARIKATADAEEARRIPILLEQLAALDRRFREQVQVIQQLTAETERLNQARQLQEFATRRALDVEDELIRIQREMARGSMTEIERRYQAIRDAADDAARAAIRAEEARRGAPLSTQEIENYYRVAREGQDRLIRATEAHIRQQRTWSEGWRRAYRQYVEDATDAARRAERIFGTFTRSMEDMIVNFAKTGKFEWRNFVSSILEELLRSQIQQVMAQIFSLPSLGGGGKTGSTMGDALGSILGLFGAGGSGKVGTTQRGNSPNAPLYVQQVGTAAGRLTTGGSPSTATPGFGGPLGGSVLDTIGSVIRGAGTVLGQAGTSAVDIIGSAGSWLNKNLFGGFFATGGMLPAGRFGVVGERGPELISGPANVTPMGGAMQVTYNINAVDARSFQQLLAQDPSFIFALTEQGRKSFAGAR